MSERPHAHTEHFFERWYRAIAIGLLAIIAIGSFMLGVTQGKRQGTASVQLLCDQNVLKQLTIPVKDIVYAGRGEENTDFSSTEAADKSDQKGMFFASKHGKKYYTPTCPAGKRIKTENKIWFSSAEDAVLQGYSPAKC